ncbi:MAG: GPW/gp25 family protein [Richelia sp. RM2_1_2]|nr:GPW/gp25 family protein [Richelia sp. RM2_1_2]
MAQQFRGFSTVNAGPKNNELVDIELIKRDILNVFSTRKGERLMYPNLGSVIWELIYDPMDETNKELIITDAVQIIASEPRVELIDTRVIEFEHGIRLEIDVLYRPSNVPGSLEIEFDRRAEENI